MGRPEGGVASVSGFSLPEERILVGKGQANELEPISLDVADSDLQRWKEKARQILDSGGRFSNEDLHRILARQVLGL